MKIIKSSYSKFNNFNIISNFNPKFLLLITMVVFCGVFLLSGADVSKAATSSGWESEADLVRIGDDDKWSMQAYAFPHIAYNLRGDGKWVLISNRESTDHYYGYYYDNTISKWVEDSSLVTGLVSQGWRDYPAFAYNVTGDGNWTLISHQGSSFYGYYWNGTQWVEDFARVNGLSNFDVGAWWKTSHTFIENLTGDGNWSLLTGMGDGTFRAFDWDGTQWTEDSLRVNGLPSIGGNSRVTAGFNVFGENKWNLIATNVSSKSFRVFCWDGTQWIEDSTKAAGLFTDLPELVPTLGYNVTGDGKWVLISGIGQLYTLLGFQYNSVDTSSLPSQTDVASYNSLATTARIKFSYPNTWNHRIKYSTNSDMTGALWSEWFEDIDEVDVKLTHLNPSTTYYYEAYTYIPWDTSYYVKSSVKSFNTLSSQNPITVNPGSSIQDAIEMLPLSGGTVNLAAGIHNVNDTIVIDMSNVTIHGTHSSEIRSTNSDKDIFVIPHESPNAGEDWANMPVLENLIFKGFKVTSSYTSRGAGLINAWNVKNLVVEDILDESYIGYLAIINPCQTSTVHSEDIYIRNNILTRSCISFRHSTNIHVINNRLINTAIMSAINIGRNNSYVYIYDNYVNGGTNYCIRGHGGNHVWIENNTLFSAPIGIYNDALSNATISNNTITDCSYGAINIDPQPVLKDVKITNNRIYNNSGDGIMTTIHGGFKEEVSDIDIINNIIYNNGGNGIEMRQEWVKLNIKNNIITNNEGYGINYIETQEPTIHSYNYFDNNTQGNFNGTIAGVGDIEAVAGPKFADVANEDFHLKSTAGRWTEGGWVTDSEHSPCIDAGDPIDDYSNEPSSNGDRINMGAYGNTTYASKSGSGASDTTPPVRSNGAPTGTLTYGTTSTTISLATDENATCKYSATSGVAYSSMTNTFSTTGTTSHSQTIAGLTNGSSYTYYIRCQDTIGNPNTDDYLISFSIDTEPQAGDLVAHWKFDENTGDIAYDSSGNNNNGTLINMDTSTAWVDGKIGANALEFDGTNDYVDCGIDANCNGEGTLEVWLKADFWPNYCGIAAKGNSGTAKNISYGLWGYADGRPRFIVANGTTSDYVKTITALSTGQWYHLVGTWDETNLTVYINGIQDNQESQDVAQSSNARKLLIGGGETGKYFFNGAIDDVRIYSRALTPAEVMAHYNEGNNPTPPTNHLPIGNLDTATQTSITGWAYDLNAGTNPINVHIYIDGNPIENIIANLNRPDIIGAGSGQVQDPNHGFTFSTPSLSIGDHTVSVYAINQPEGTNPELIGSPIVFNISTPNPDPSPDPDPDPVPDPTPTPSPSPTPSPTPTPDPLPSPTDYPEGTLLKTPDSFKIYIIINQKKKWIPTPEVFETLGYQWTSITIIEKNQLTLIPDYEDNLIRAINDFKVYLIVQGIKRHLPNPEIFLNYGFNWNEVKDVNQETINQYTQCNLIKESKKEEIYYLCPIRKIKRWLRSPEIFNSYPDNNWNNIQVISKYEMDHYPESNLIKLHQSNDVYLIEGNKKRLINSAEEFEREGLDWGKVMGVGEVEIDWFIL